MKRTLLLLLIILLLAVTFTACAGDSFENLTISQLLEIGERHLLDFDYEQAIIYFARMIEIDPMNPRGHVGLARAHLGLGNRDSARDVLENAPDDPEVGDMLGEMDREDREEEERQAQESLESGNLADLIASLPADTEFPLIFGNIGIYHESSAGGFMVYQGGFVDGQREGFGRWFRPNGNYFSEGQWNGDMPNGSFHVRWGSGYTRTGSVVNGLWNGEVVFVTLVHGAATVQYNMGRVVVLERWYISASGSPNVIGFLFGGSTLAPGQYYTRLLLSDEEANRLRGIFGFAD